jgi:hypothetical protein
MNERGENFMNLRAAVALEEAILTQNTHTKIDWALALRHRVIIS